MNKPNRETLQVFGRILYALAMSDGKLHDEEVDALHEIVKKDEWAREVEFSFEMAKELDMDPKMMFLKNMRIFRAQPVDEHYPFFLGLMQKIALAHNGIVPEEKALIEKFRSYFLGTGLHGAPKHYGAAMSA